MQGTFTATYLWENQRSPEGLHRHNLASPFWRNRFVVPWSEFLPFKISEIQKEDKEIILEVVLFYDVLKWFFKSKFTSIKLGIENIFSSTINVMIIISTLWVTEFYSKNDETWCWNRYIFYEQVMMGTFFSF